MPFGGVFRSYLDYNVATESWKAQTLPTTPYDGLMGYDGTALKFAVGTTWYDLALNPSGSTAAGAYHALSYWAQDSNYTPYRDAWRITGNVSNFYIAMAEGPASAPSVALAGAGAGNVDNGAHYYKVTFVTPGGETEAGTASSVVTVANNAVNGKVSVTSIPVGTSGFVTSRKLYRTAAGGTTYQLLATIADNTTTTYTDNIADASLGATAPTTNSAIDTRVTVGKTGGIGLANTAALFSWTGGSQISNVSDGVIKLANSAGTAFTRLSLGGTTSSYPSIKRNSAAIDLELADGSGYANLNCGPVRPVVGQGTQAFNGSDGGYITVSSFTYADTTGTSLSTAHCRWVIHNSTASGDIVETLPSSIGYYDYTFWVGSNHYLKIQASAGDQIRIGTGAGNLTAVAGYIRSTAVGSWVRLVSIDATYWAAVSIGGTWTVDS